MDHASFLQLRDRIDEMNKGEQGRSVVSVGSINSEQEREDPSTRSGRFPETRAVAEEVADLDQLVRQLNQPGVSLAAPDLPKLETATLVREPTQRRATTSRQFQICDELEQLLRVTIAQGASDLHVVAGAPAYFRIDGELRNAGVETVTQANLGNWFQKRLTENQLDSLKRSGAVDFSARLLGISNPSVSRSEAIPACGARFRINVHRQRGGLAASLRMLPSSVPNLEGLDLPESLRDLVRPMQGVVLLCGPTGAGKSSTLAALVDGINRDRRAHILTLEDPIEFEHSNHRSLVEQMEVGTDIPSFSEGLRAALRQDPDVILLGEMRDLDSIATALAAAETGHLLLSTVHASDPSQAIRRVVDVFPAEAREQMRQLLAVGFEAIVCQKLVPKIGGGRVPALEILKATAAVRHHIRSGDLHKLYNEMVTGRRVGMVTMEASLARLVGAGVVAREVALARTSRPEEFESVLRHESGPSGSRAR